MAIRAMKNLGWAVGHQKGATGSRRIDDRVVISRQSDGRVHGAASCFFATQPVWRLAGPPGEA